MIYSYLIILIYIYVIIIYIIVYSFFVPNPAGFFIVEQEFISLGQTGARWVDGWMRVSTVTAMAI